MPNPIIPFYRQIDHVITKSEGCFLYDAGNKQYIDFESGDWAAVLGHTNDRINRVIKEQSELVMHDGLRFRNRPSEELALQLLQLLSFAEGKCTFLNSGSEAVNLSITLARNFTGRTSILKTDSSYLAAFGHGQIYSDNPDIVNIELNNTDAIATINFDNIAAFVFEPGNARGLIKFPHNQFIQSLASAVKENGGFLIANEVTTGFRTGKWFGYQHYDFNPDIVAMGKALGNGYPVSCVAVTGMVAALFDRTPFRYAQSHQNDPLGCAVAVEVIKIFMEEGLLQQSIDKGKYFFDRLQQLQMKFPHRIIEVRGRGLMLAIEFNPEIDVEMIYGKLMDRGLLVGCRSNVLSFMPPVIIQPDHIDVLISTMESLLL
jgi:acetylornithine aminotransferase